MRDETLQRPLTVEQHDVVYTDRNQIIRRYVAQFDGFSKEYFVSDHGRRAAVLVVRQDEVLFVRQYRLLINGISLEIPGGRVDASESSEQAAARECMEETGVRCANLKPLVSFHPSLDIWDNFTQVFLATETEETDARSAERVWLPLGKCMSKISAQEIVDSLSLIALMAYRSMADAID